MYYKVSIHLLGDLLTGSVVLCRMTNTPWTLGSAEKCQC